MQTFFSWLQTEARRPDIPQPVLQSYEREFRSQLERLIQRTDDPVLREKFRGMLDCPVTDRQGRCHSFTGYILATLIRQGIFRRFDIEAVLQHVVSQMLMDRSLKSGNPRSTVFGGFDASRGYGPGENPLQARFLTTLQNTVRNVAAGRLPSLSNTPGRRAGTVSIGAGRSDDDLGTISADQIAARPSDDADLGELMSDLEILLAHRERAEGLPLTTFFHDMMSGLRNADQRRKYGDKTAGLARQAIVDTIRTYAEETGNHALLTMLKRFEEFDGTKPAEPRRKPEKVERPKLSPVVSDFVSIVALIEKLGRPIGTADLGKHRRKWLQYPPREPDSPHRNRLDETLARMTEAGVLVKRPTGRGGLMYSPGPEFERYRELAAA